MQKSRLAGSIGLAVALSLSVAACGSSSSSKPAASSTAASVTVPTLTGTETAVTLNMGTITALKGLGVTVGFVGKAHAETLSDGAAVAFPITGGHVAVYPKTVTPYVQGEIDHAGSGLSLTVGKKVLDVTDFVVNPGTSMLTATLGGKAGFPLFFLNGSNLAISPVGKTYHLDGTVVSLLPSAASAIDSYFGVPAGTVPAAVIGVAHIIAA